MIYATDKRSLASAKSRIRIFLKGAILGFALACASFYLIDCESNVEVILLLLASLFGGLFFLAGREAPIWFAGAGIAAGILVINFTPFDQAMMDYLRKEDPLQSCPAVVVLSASEIRGDTVPPSYMLRIVHGYETLKGGYARSLVLSSVDAKNENYRYVTRQMRALGLKYPVESIGLAHDTHDEALGAAKLAKLRHWDRVILVTQPTHMRRAAAVFEKAGLKVIASPCQEDNFVWDDAEGLKERMYAFKRCLHEIVGYWAYQRRGWI